MAAQTAADEEKKRKRLEKFGAPASNGDSAAPVSALPQSAKLTLQDAKKAKV
jgi:hypothetical protein